MNLYNRFLSDSIKYYYKNLTTNPILEPKRSWDFIQEYFILGEKEKAFDLEFAEKLKRNGKNIHTVSMYYIGCLLSKMIESNLTDTLHELIPGFGQDFNYKFIYSWFLTCLYHDIAFVIEDERGLIDCVGTPKFHLKEMFIKNGITYNVFDHKWTGEPRYTYSKYLVQNYFYYCLTYRGKIDHGIIGGFILYDRLKKNYEAKWNEYKSKNMITDQAQKAFFKLDGLSWRIQHLDHFAYISDAIIAHNIWYNKDIELYKKFGLSKLKERTGNKISKRSNTLLFFLAIVDTIEPTKFFDKISPQWIWQNIDIHYDSSTNRVKIKILSPILIYEKWLEKIKTLESWLYVSVEHSPEEMQIIISIEQ
jgi:hypothetical protein